MLAIFKREFSMYFKTASGYIAFAIFAFLSGYIFVSQYASGKVNIASEITNLRSFFVVLIPIVTMGLFSEDKKRGTEVLYYTTPTNIASVVIGKFLSAMALFGIMFINVLVQMFITVCSGGVIDAGTMGAIVVYFFLTALFVALGLFASAVTDSQIIAAIFSFLIILLIQLTSTISALISSTFNSFLSAKVFNIDQEKLSEFCSNVEKFINWFDPLSKTKDFRYGVFSISPLFYCACIAGLFLFLTYQVLEKKRWTQS